jgi:uncharacterized protein
MAFLRTAAGRGFVVLALGLLFAALLDARGLRKQAQVQPQGAERRVALRLTKPLLRVSDALHLTSARRELQVATGRQHEDEIDTRIRLALPPPANVPASKPVPTRRRTHRRPAKPRFTRAHPLRVWVAGDSLAQVPGEGLERVAPPSVRVLSVESRLSTGLARPDLYNWYTRFADVIESLHPDVAVLSFGADDAHGYMTGVPAGRSVGPLGSATWDAEYRRRVDGVTRELNAAGIYVVWLGLPIPDGPGFRQSFPVVNHVLESVVRARPRRAAFVDTWHMLDDAHGRYAAYLRVGGRLTLLRLPDGVHYTAAAGDLIARRVLEQLERVYALASGRS